MEINGKVGNSIPRCPQNPWVVTSVTPTPWEISLRSDKGFLLPAPAHAGAYRVTRLLFFGYGDAVQPSPLRRFSRSIGRQMTSFRARMCLLVVPKTIFFIFQAIPPQKKTQIFGQFLTGLKFCVRKALTMAMLTCKLPLIVIIAPWKLCSG